MSEQPFRPGSELERLRDILYGDYARTTAVQLDELLDQLKQYQNETINRLQSQANHQANQLEVTREQLEEKIELLNQRLNAFQQEMERQLDLMDDAKADRRALGRMLVALGQQLQAENE